MDLFFDERDEKAGDAARRRVSLLEDMGARPSSEAGDHDHGFLFSMRAELDDYRRLIAGRPDLKDQTGERAAVNRLERVRLGLSEAEVALPLPAFRAAQGGISGPVVLRPSRTLEPRARRPIRVSSDAELATALAELALTADEGLLHSAALWERLERAANEDEPRRIRIWIVDSRPVLWSAEAGVACGPLTASQADELSAASRRFASAFDSAFLVIDWGRLDGGWIILDAGPGSRALASREVVLRAAVRCLAGLSEAPEPGGCAGALGGTAEPRV